MVYYQVWRHIELVRHLGQNLEAPPSANMDDLGFPKKEIFKYGLKRSITFYRECNFDSRDFIDPLMAVSIKTVFTEGVPNYQILHTSWKLENDAWSEPIESRILIRKPNLFLQKMRSRVIEELISLATDFGLGEQIKVLYKNYSKEIYIYEKGGSSEFKQAVIQSQEEWLNLPSSDGRTVRDVIVQYLSIGEVD